MKKTFLTLFILGLCLSFGIAYLVRAADTEIMVTIDNVFTDAGDVAGEAMGTGGFSEAGSGSAPETGDEDTATAPEDSAQAQETLSKEEQKEAVLEKREEMARIQIEIMRGSAQEQMPPDSLAANLPVTGKQDALFLILIPLGIALVVTAVPERRKMFPKNER